MTRKPQLRDQRHTVWNTDSRRRNPRRFIIAQALTLALADIINRQNAQRVRVVIIAERHAAAPQAVMLDHLLHLQLDDRTIHALRRDVALHEDAVEAPGDPRVRVDIVLHAGDVLA